MAYPGKVISNPKTGQEITFITTGRQTNGAMLEMESVFKPGSVEPPLHYHPKQKEVFTIIEGTLTVRINNGVKIFFAGDSFEVPASAVHAMWNHSAGKTVINWRVYPALDTEYFFETAMGIAKNKPTNNMGMPGLLQVVLLAGKFSDVLRLTKPPFALQRIIFLLLKPFAYVAGYKAVYKEYID